MNLVDYNDMVKSYHEETDRAAAVLAGSFVEAYLGNFLKSFMIEDDASENLLSSKGYGPLGTFGARRECAFAFGLIDSTVRKDLTYIARIRNEFAHNPNQISFSSSPVRELCQNLSTASCETPRSQYLIATGLVVGTLHNIMLQQKLQKNKSEQQS